MHIWIYFLKRSCALSCVVFLWLFGFHQIIAFFQTSFSCPPVQLLYFRYWQSGYPNSGPGRPARTDRRAIRRVTPWGYPWQLQGDSRICVRVRLR